MTNSSGHHGLSDEDSDSEIMDYSQELKRKSKIEFDVDLSIHYEIPNRPKKIPRVTGTKIYSSCLASLSNPANLAAKSLILQVDDLAKDFLKMKLLNKEAFKLGAQMKSTNSNSIKNLSIILGQYNKEFINKEKMLSTQIQQQLDKLADNYKERMLAMTLSSSNDNNEIINKPLSRKQKQFDKSQPEANMKTIKDASTIPSRFKESIVDIALSAPVDINSHIPMAPLISTPAPLSPPATSAALASAASALLSKSSDVKNIEIQSISSTIAVGISPDYISLANKKIETLVTLEDRIKQAIITEEWRNTIASRLDDILQRLVFLSENSLNIQKENNLNDSLQIENFVLAIAVDAKDIIREASTSTSNKDIIIAIAWKLISQLIDSATRTMTEEGLWLLGFIAYNICEMIPSLWSSIFFPFLVKNNPLVLPDFYFQFHNNNNNNNVGSNNNNMESKFRLLLLYGNILINASNAPTTTTATILYYHDSYLWLSRSTQQFYNISTKLISSTITSNALQIQLYSLLLIVCKSLRLFLRSVGSILYSYFHTKFIEILEKIQKYLISLKKNPIILRLASDEKLQQSSLKSSLVDLLEIIQNILINPNKLRTVKASQECHILKGKTLKRFLDIFRLKAESVDNNKSIEMQQRKNAIRINVPGTEISRLNGTFNIIGENPESQQKALTRLQQTIVQTSAAGDKELLQHALYKLSLVAVTHCQTQHFSVEKHALSVVKVLNELCNDSPILQDLLRAQFYTMCPFCIPIFTIENANPNEFRDALGFKSAISKEDAVTVIWESDDRWIDRMSKLLGTYATLAIQANGSIFTAKDIWAWLSRTVNYCGSISPPWMIARILYTVLTIVSSNMKSHIEFGSSFITLLRIIRENIVPRLNQSDQYIGDQQRLQKYLDDELNK